MSRRSIRHAFNVSLALIVALSGFLIVLPAASAAPSGCKLFEYIAARGSGQKPQGSSTDYSAGNNYGMGFELRDVYDRLNVAFPNSVTPYGVHYPAVSIWPGGFTSLGDLVNGAGALLHIKFLGEYTDSVRAGTADAARELRATHKACPATRFILGGYSQGAQAVGDALQRTLTTSEQSLVAGAVFFGDPYFNARSWSARSSFDASRYGIFGPRVEWPASLKGRIFSYCHKQDPICNISRRQHILGDGDLYYRDPRGINKEAHSSYATPKDSGDTTRAAADLAFALGATREPPSSNAPLDLVFAIDSTGSMGEVISSVEDNVEALARTIASTSSNYRFALVDYKDDPANDSSYQARVDSGFTTDVDGFAAAVRTITADGGGDTPESVYSGVMTALGLPWRDGVRKSVIAIGDAPGKDPEPVTGFSQAAVRAKALAVDPAQVYAVQVGSDAETKTFLTSLATATGGSFTAASNTDEFVATLKKAIVAAGTAPLADIGGPYEGLAGDPVALSAAATRDFDEPVIGYDWDFDGDGTYDLTTTNPLTEHTYGAAGTYRLVLRARSESGLAGTATTLVTVTVPATTAPGRPMNLRASVDGSSVALNWAPGSDLAARYYTVRGTDGLVLDRIAALTPTPNWLETDLTPGTYRYTVTGGNERGEGPVAGPVTALVAASPSAPPSPTPTASARPTGGPVRPSTSAVTTHNALPVPGGSRSPSAAAPSGALPFTGTPLRQPVGFGGIAVLIGVVLLLIARRRRQTPSTFER